MSPQGTLGAFSYLILKRKGKTIHSSQIFYFFGKDKMLDKELELAKLDNITTLEDLEAWYQAILGKKGQLSEQLKSLATMTPEEKKEKG